MLWALLLARACAAAYVSLTFYTGDYTTVVVFNDSAPLGSFVLTRYNDTSRTLYVVGLVSEGSVDQALCQPSFVTRVLIAPRG